MKNIKGLALAGLAAIAGAAAWTICEACMELNKFARKEVAVGDLVQWTSGGVDMFETPRRVVNIMDSRWGKYAYVEGTSKTGVPVSQLRVVK